MKTSAIILRVADFLRAYPPFSYLTEEGLLEVARSGRVRYCEKGEILFEEGAARGKSFFVIQKGAVRLVRGVKQDLADLRGQGDFIGAGAVLGETKHGHTALVAEDSIIYALDVAVFSRVCSASWQASRFLAIYFVASEFGEDRSGAEEGPSWAGGEALHQERLRSRMASGAASTPIRDAAAAMSEKAGAAATSAAFVVVDGHGCPTGIITDTDLRNQVATGRVPVDASVAAIMRVPVRTAPPGVAPSDALLRMIRHGVRHLCITADGTPCTRALGVLSDGDVALSQGNSPLALVREIRRCASPQALQPLGERLGAMLLGALNAPADVPWCARLAAEARRAMFLRAEAWARAEMGPQPAPMALVLAGSAGRGEPLTQTDFPFVVLWDGDESARPWMEELVRRIDALLVGAGFQAPRLGALGTQSDRCRTTRDWAGFYRETVRDPLGSEVWTRMTLFDLDPVSGDSGLLDWVREEFREELSGHPEFIFLLANDALGNLPPVTIFEGYAVDASGLMRETVDVKAFALGPVSDIARVFHLDGGRAVITNTLERLEAAAARIPAGADVFRAAGRAFRVAQYFRGRNGLRNGTAGDEVSPALLTRTEQVMMKSAFRAIADLISFTQAHYVSRE